jgi:cell division protein FtsI (penicillin-binding protein 3)
LRSELTSIRKRGRIIFAFLILMGLIFVARAVQIQIIQHGKFSKYARSQQQSAMPLKARRGAIYDCEGRALAYDVEARTYTVNPGYMKSPGREARKLARLTGKSTSYWKRRFRQHPGFLVVADRVPQEKESSFEESGIETLRSRTETVRVYPYGQLAGEIVGKMGIDDVGLSGLEKQYDGILSGVDGSSIYLRDARGKAVTTWEHTIVQPRDGSDVYLALDIDLQQIVEDELEEMLHTSGSLWGSAIFLDVETGGILACATVEKYRPRYARCRNIVDMNEPGSTLKIVPLACVFQAGIFEPDDIVNVEGGRFRVGRRSIRDDHAYDSLRCDEIGIYSSNIGASKLGIASGGERIYRTLVRFGFGAKTGIDFPGESAGSLQKPEGWSDHLLANICFGYGVATTGIQIAAAYGAIASGGDLLKPYFASHLVRPGGKMEILNSRSVVRKVIDGSTVRVLNDIFREVVRRGTAVKARDDLGLIAGKTGTALRLKKEGRGYDPRRSLASFAGYFPEARPRVVGYIMFDEPQTSIYGGEVAAPVMKKIARRYVSLPKNSLLVAASDKGADPDEGSNANLPGEATILTASVSRSLPASDIRNIETNQGQLPDFRGMTMREALVCLRTLSVEFRIVGSGVVKSQIPPPGTAILRVESVELIGGRQ